MGWFDSTIELHYDLMQEHNIHKHVKCSLTRTQTGFDIFMAALGWPGAACGDVTETSEALNFLSVAYSGILHQFNRTIEM